MFDTAVAEEVCTAESTVRVASAAPVVRDVVLSVCPAIVMQTCIPRLGPVHADLIARHLLALPADDRYMRFGGVTGDGQIQRFVQQIDFGRDAVFGIFNQGLELAAVAHLAWSTDRQGHAVAEFAGSVCRASRGSGLGTRLFGRCAEYARDRGAQTLFIHTLSENQPMLRIVRRAGAVVERDGAESTAFLPLEPLRQPDINGAGMGSVAKIRYPCPVFNNGMYCNRTGV